LIDGPSQLASYAAIGVADLNQQAIDGIVNAAQEAGQVAFAVNV